MNTRKNIRINRLVIMGLRMYYGKYSIRFMKNAWRRIVFVVCILGVFILGWIAYGKISTRESRVALCHECNIVMIVVDPLRADALESLGNKRSVTPVLNELASRGYIFTNAMAASSWTLPSAMSLMTGVYPSLHGIVNKDLLVSNSAKETMTANLGELHPTMRTFAQEFKEQGYATAAFTGGAAMEATYGFDQGFDVYESLGNFAGLPAATSSAIAFVEKHADDKIFLLLHGFDVHGQYIPPGGLDRRFVDASYKGKLVGSTEEQKNLREEGVLQGKIFLEPDDVAFLRAVYDEKVAFMDKSIGEFIAVYDKLGLSRDTIFVVTSSHGEEFYEHGRIDHGMTLYDEVLHIPLVVIPPKNSGNRKVSQQVRNIDILPTLFSLAGLTLTPSMQSQIQGESLLPLMEGKTLSLDIYPETVYRYATMQRAIRSADGWKLILDEEMQTKKLFNITKDRGELVDIYQQSSSQRKELLEKLLQHIDEMRQPRTNSNE
jgi:arylsulfatase A-like enzyme